MTKENKKRLVDAINKGYKVKYPSLPDKYYAIPKYSDKTANGLTKCIIDFLNNSGHQGERISSTGRQIESTKTTKTALGTLRTKSSKWIKSTSTNGTADISSTIGVRINSLPIGLSVKWEVKIGRDTQSEDQKKYEQNINHAAGHYYIVKSFDDFILKYDNLINFYNN